MTIMPRVFTEKERDYMADLVARNRGRTYQGDPSDGAERPMSGAERTRRSRIREKAELTLHDLVMVHMAGLWDDRDAVERVSQVDREARADLAGLDDEGERWFYAMGGDRAEAEDVDI